MGLRRAEARWAPSPENFWKIELETHSFWCIFEANVQGRTGSPNRPGKFSLTGPHYRAENTNLSQYFRSTTIVISVVQQSWWFALKMAKDIRVNRFKNYLARIKLFGILAIIWHYLASHVWAFELQKYIWPQVTSRDQRSRSNPRFF